MEQPSQVCRVSRSTRIILAAALVAVLFITARSAGAQSFDTAFGSGALASNVSGNNDSAFGANALNLNTSGSFNSATGNGALATNNADNNTATGFEALLNN